MQISAGYLCRIETGQRCPSTAVARRLAEMLPMTESERAELFAAALPNVGRDHPSRHARIGGPEHSETGLSMGNGQSVFGHAFMDGIAPAR